MKQFNVAINIVKDLLIENFGKTKFEEFSRNAQKEFENLIPQLPYIGGRKNRNTENLINGSLVLVLVRIFEKEGLEFREIGKLCYDLYETFYEVLPISEDIFQEEYINQWKKDAKESQLRKYPGDWVFEFVEGDGKTFDYGINYIECGLCKFLKEQDAEDLIPLLCLADYANARASGYGLKRTQTIGNGASICDFRFIKGGRTPRGWPPDNIQEFKKKL